MYSTILLHANLQYAEIPKEEISKVVERSYLPVLESLVNYPSVAVTLNFTGVTLEILKDKYPEVIDVLKEGIRKGKFELTACGYSHPIFPLLPQKDCEKQIEFHLEVLKDSLDYTPAGFWLPELAYDPTLPRILKKMGIKYTFFDDELYELSSPLKNDNQPFNSPIMTSDIFLLNLMKAKSIPRQLIEFFRTLRNITKMCKKTDFSPVELKGAKGTITGLRAPKSWVILSYASMLGYPFLNQKKAIRILKKYKKSSGLVMPYCMDIEFFGYRSYIGGRLVTEKHLIDFIDKMIQIDGNEMILPSKYLDTHKSLEIGYMKTGSWAPDRRLDIWTKDEDNAKLERLCQEVRDYMRLLPDNDIDREIWKNLLLAENSDGRGWDPICQRRLDCYSHALEALRLIKEKISRPT